MEVRIKPVAAFYCCYLLRSTTRHSSLYVGSSPHPQRRIDQHNGKSKGGAVRTSRSSLRPWEMVCIVLGFPSNIAALQFEWAWHNAHLTKHISPEDRLSLPVVKSRVNQKTGKSRKKLGRPRTSMIDKLSNLHLLLRAPYFSKMPLELRFFNAAVFKSWQAWDARVDKHVPTNIRIVLDLPEEGKQDGLTADGEQVPKKRKEELFGTGGVAGVDPTYARFQPVFLKLHNLLAQKEIAKDCDICEKRIDVDKELFSVCLDPDCCSLTHLSCLSKKFLKESSSAALVPSTGTCPSCTASLQWADLMRVLTLRMRGQKEIDKLLKRRRANPAVVAAEMLDEHSDSEEEEDIDMLAASDEEEDDSGLEDSIPAPNGTAPSKGSDRLEIVIEDSEDDG